MVGTNPNRPPYVPPDLLSKAQTFINYVSVRDEEKLAIYAYFLDQIILVGGLHTTQKHAYVVYEWSPPYISTGFFKLLGKLLYIFYESTKSKDNVMTFPKYSFDKIQFYI